MKRTIRYVLGFSLFALAFAHFSVSAFQQQGFTAYQEGYNSALTFTCESQCIVVLGTLGSNDYLQLNGTVEGQGTIGFGFLVGQQVAGGPMVNVQGNGNLPAGRQGLNQKFNFSEVQFFSQIPKEAQVVLLVQGIVKGSEVQANLRYLSFFEKFDQAWKDFWKMEPMTPYTINLRYGVKILGTSITQYGYRIFVLVALYILLFTKKSKEQKRNTILLFGIGIFLFIGLRNLVTDFTIVQQGVKGYSTSKTLFDLNDYIPFTEQIRKKLDLDTGKKDCKIQVNAYQDRPFKAHRESVYLKPCKLVNTGSEADYILYYHVPFGSGDANKEVLLQLNDSYLLLNK